MVRRKPSEIVTAADFARAFQVSRETVERLNLYESLLRRWQPAVNLVAPGTLGQVWGRHFADSAQIAARVPDQARCLVDLGSGGGFPGLVLAIVCGIGARATESDGKGLHRVILVESDSRKAAFLREVARQTCAPFGMPVDILSIRIEKAATQFKAGPVDLVTARALAPLDRLLDLAQPLFGPATIGLFLKGQDAQAEIDVARKRWSFDVSLVPSVTHERAGVVEIRRLGARAASGPEAG